MSKYLFPLGGPIPSAKLAVSQEQCNRIGFMSAVNIREHLAGDFDQLVWRYLSGEDNESVYVVVHDVSVVTSHALLEKQGAWETTSQS